MFGIGGKIVKWHYEIIDGRMIRVIDRFELTEVSIIPERRPTPDATDELLCSRCGVNPAYENGICWDCLDG